MLAGFEVGDDGEHSAVVVVGFGEVEFGEDMADVFSTLPSIGPGLRLGCGSHASAVDRPKVAVGCGVDPVRRVRGARAARNSSQQESRMTAGHDDS